jgi:hypothetical protein
MTKRKSYRKPHRKTYRKPYQKRNYRKTYKAGKVPQTQTVKPILQELGRPLTDEELSIRLRQEREAERQQQERMRQQQERMRQQQETMRQQLSDIENGNNPLAELNAYALQNI